MHIASIHNPPRQYCSPPSSKNFQMLGLEFEEFELISSQDELWILKSNEIIFDDETIAEILKNQTNILMRLWMMLTIKKDIMY